MWNRKEIDIDLMTKKLKIEDMINNLEESLGIKLVDVDGWNYKAENSLTSKQVTELENNEYEVWHEGENDFINIEY